MKITKLGHCCLVIEEAGSKILTDPGLWTTAQNEIKDVDLILITHEHSDHLHIDSLKQVLKNNPQAEVFTNSSVKRILDESGIDCRVVEDGQNQTLDSVLIEGMGQEHAYIYETVPTVQNTGYFINNKLFYPGDALYNPGKAVEILALPVAGPWLEISEAIDYAKAINPQICFPVHDGMLNEFGKGFHVHPENALKENNIDFKSLSAGQSLEV